MTSVPQRAFSASAVPSAITQPRSTTTDGRAGRPPRRAAWSGARWFLTDEAFHEFSHFDAGARVEAGGRPVEDDYAWPDRPDWRQGRAGPRSRSGGDRRGPQDRACRAPVGSQAWRRSRSVPARRGAPRSSLLGVAAGTAATHRTPRTCRSPSTS
jgi:hypothetical protein